MNKKVNYIIKSRCRPLCTLSNNNIVVYRKGCIGVIDENNKYSRIIKLPLAKSKKILANFRITERLLRLEPRKAVLIDDESMYLSYAGRMYYVSLKDKKYKCTAVFRHGMTNPLSITEIKGIDGFDDCFVYGDYFGNTLSLPVGIHRCKKGCDRWEKIYEFKEGRINHIHNIVPDKYNKCVYIFTGDSDCQSGIWIAHDNFKTVSPLFVGSQKFRSCVGFAVEDGLIYATDTPLEQNYIYFLKRDKDKWIHHTLCELNGSCIYGAKCANKYIFSTTVEPDSSITGFRYKITYKLGPGIKSRNAELMIGNIDGFRKLLRIKKDILPMTAFQFGSIIPIDVVNNKLIAYALALKKFDGYAIMIDIEE